MAIRSGQAVVHDCMCVFACVCVSSTCERALSCPAVLARGRGMPMREDSTQHVQMCWLHSFYGNQPPPTPPLPTTTNISLLLPSLLIAPARAWQAPLMPLASSLCESKHSWWSSHISYSSICLPRFPPSVHVKCVCMGKSLRVWIFSGHVRQACLLL